MYRLLLLESYLLLLFTTYSYCSLLKAVLTSYFLTLIVYCLLFTVYCLLLTTYCLLLIAYCLLLTAYSLRLTLCYLQLRTGLAAGAFEGRDPRLGRHQAKRARPARTRFEGVRPRHLLLNTRHGREVNLLFA